MENMVTKEDLADLKNQIVSDIKDLLVSYHKDHQTIEADWLRSKDVRKILNISPATLQNLRITGKIAFRKVLGSYYYNRADLNQLFNKI